MINEDLDNIVSQINNNLKLGDDQIPGCYYCAVEKYDPPTLIYHFDDSNNADDFCSFYNFWDYKRERKDSAVLEYR